jgi:hypothetical protein
MPLFRSSAQLQGTNGHITINLVAIIHGCAALAIPKKSRRGEEFSTGISRNRLTRIRNLRGGRTAARPVFMGPSEAEDGWPTDGSGRTRAKQVRRAGLQASRNIAATPVEPRLWRTPSRGMGEGGSTAACGPPEETAMRRCGPFCAQRRFQLFSVTILAAQTLCTYPVERLALLLAEGRIRRRMDH